MAIVGVSGSGKTYAAKGLVERLVDVHARVCVVDPLGVWWGLHAGADGSAPGLPVAVFGGRHADVALDEGMGAALGRLVGTRPLACVVDLSELGGSAARRRFMQDFAEALYEANTEPLHLVLDEADLWCLSADTELLTAEGWKTWRDITVGDSAVCFDPEHASYSYGPIERVIVREHDGPMVRLLTKSLDCLCTPDHRVVLERMQRAPGRYGKPYGWTFCQADAVPTCVRVPIGGAPVGPGVTGALST